MSTPAISNVPDPVFNYEPFLIFGDGFVSGTSQVFTWTSALSRTVSDASLSSGSATLVSNSANFTSDDVGASLTGTGIPVGTIIANVTSSTTVVMSAAATSSQAGDSVTITDSTPIATFLSRVVATYNNTGSLPQPSKTPPNDSNVATAWQQKVLSQSRTVFDASLTSGSTTLTSNSANFTSNDVGASLTGTGIPVGTIIANVTDSTTVAMSVAATSSQTDESVTITVSSTQVIGGVLLAPKNNPAPLVLWVTNDSGATYSSPYLVNVPQLYFVEFGGILTPGQQARVFGKNLCASGGSATPSLWLTNISNSNLAAPSIPTLTAVMGTSNGAAIYVVITYVNAYGETTASTESTLTPLPNQQVQVTSPTTMGNASGYNIYVGSASGGPYYLQNNSVIPIGTPYTIPGTATPSAPTLTAVTGTSNGAAVYVVITYVIPYGESIASTQSTLTPSTIQQVQVTSPSTMGNASGYNVYAGTASGGPYYLQNTSGAIAIGTPYTIPSTPASPGTQPPTQPSTQPPSTNTASTSIYPLTWGKAYDYQGSFNYQLQYELRFIVPSTLPTGDYNLWVYSGTGGNYGFGAPLPVTIQSASTTNPPTVNVMSYGATGNGTTDDTWAILEAQTALAFQVKGGPGILCFPEGDYLLSQPIPVVPGISLQGHSQERSRLIASPTITAPSGTIPIYGTQTTVALVYLSSNSQISYLTLEGNQNTNACVLITNSSQQVSNATVTHCTLRNPYALLSTLTPPSGNDHYGYAVKLVGQMTAVEVSYCSLHAIVGIYPLYGPFLNCRTLLNRFHGDPILSNMHGTAEMGWIIGQNCIIEGNLCEYSNRGFTCGAFFGPVEHNFIARNVVQNGRFTMGAGESYLFELTLGNYNTWYGSPSEAGTNYFKQTSKAWTVNYVGYQVVVISGTGFGQVRTVASNTTDTITLTQPWNVVPDTTSVVLISRFAFQNLLISNASRSTEGGLEMGNALDNMIDAHELFHSRNGIFFGASSVPAGDLYPFPLGIIAFNHVRNCNIAYCSGLQSSGGVFWRYSGLKMYADRTLEGFPTAPVPLCFGNRFIGSYWNHSGIMTEDQVLDSSYSWVSPTDPRRQGAPPSIAFNAMCNSGDIFRAQESDDPNIAIDPWTLSTVLFLPPVQGAETPTVVDKGQSTVTFT